MKSVRKVVFWLHLSAGVGAAAVILLMSVTGLLLAYERQILAWAERDQRTVGVSPGAERLTVENLLARVRESRPETKPQALTVQADPERAAAVSLGREGVLFVDPYTGSVLGEGSRSARGFFRAVTDWHRWLGAAGESRTLARAVTGAANLAFLFMLLSGLYLWWPRTWSRPALRAVTWFSRGLSGRARDFNWHNVAGVWSFVPLLFIVSSAVLLSYPRGGQGQGPRNESGRPTIEGLDALWSRAERQVPGWRSLSVRFPASANAPVVFTIDRGDGARPDLRALLTLDPKTGAAVSFEPYSSQSPGRRLRAWARWVHTGEAGGLAGQTTAAIVSAAAALLACTGVALAWRRWRAWLAGPAQAPAGARNVAMIREGGIP